MIWSKADLKIFAAGLAVGGKWKGASDGESFEAAYISPAIIGEPVLAKRTSGDNFNAAIISNSIVGNIVEVTEE